MQENRVQRKRKIYKGSRRRKQLMIKRCVGFVFWLVVLAGLVWLCSGNEAVESASIPSPTVSTETQDTISSPEDYVKDPNNNVYPYSMVSKDWGTEIYEQGWAYYELPSSYKMAGGMFPEVAQVYLWDLCNEAKVDYYMVLAMIERESGYRYNALGDNGNSKGLLQVQERWHKERMQAVGATDLYNPYDNMRVAVNFIKEIQDRYLESSGAHCVLMVYNMGASGAKKLWSQGIYTTEYSRQILQRAQEIKQELID